MELQGKTVIVTGAGRGVGRALALEFAKQGANVVVCARRDNEINETARLIDEQGGTAMVVKTDVTDAGQVKNMVDQTLNTFGQIDVLFNNAGSFASLGGLWEVDPDEWWQDVTVNLRGSMLTCHAVLPHMIKRDQGVIINMGGGGSGAPLTGGSGYASSKTALLRMTENLAVELEHEGSNVLAVLMGPGLVRTEMTEHQVNSPMGRKWIPSTATSFEQGKVRPPEACAVSTMELLKHICPAFNGRSFGTGNDFAALAKQAQAIKDQGLRVLRMKNS